MRKTLSLALEQLADAGPLASAIAANVRAGNAIDVQKEVDNLRIRIFELLSMVVSYLDRHAIKVGDVPRELKPALDRLIERLASFQTVRDYERIEAALKAVWGLRSILTTELVSTGLSNLTGQLESGLGSVKSAEEEASKTNAARRRAEVAELTAIKSAGGAQESAKQALEAKRNAEAGEKATASAQAKAEEARETAEDHRNDALKSRKAAQSAADHSIAMRKRVDEVQQHLDSVLGEELASIDEQHGRREEIERDLTETSERARKVFFQATTAALALEWQNKRIGAQWIMAVWIAVLAATVGLAVASSVFMAVPEVFERWLPASFFTHLSQSNVPFERQVLTKLFIVPPLIFAVWFAASQYTHARDRQQEYAKRETVAKTLDSYRQFLTDLAGDDQTKIDKVSELFTSSISNLWAFVLSRDDEKEPMSFSLFRRKELSVEDFIELGNKLKSLNPMLPEPPKK